MTQKTTLPWLWKIGLSVMAATTLVSGQQKQTPAKPPQGPAVFRGVTEGRNTTVSVFDSKGDFISALTRADFKISEDGVDQSIISFTRDFNGQHLTESTRVAAAAPVAEGVILPKSSAVADSIGRIFIIFIDDAHIQFADTNNAKEILRQVKSVIHKGDTIAIVSSGHSSIEINPTHDVGRIDEAISKLMCDGMSPREIIEANNTKDGPAGLRHYTGMAFSTVYGMLDQLTEQRDRRKAFIYISSGYDFNPYAEARWKRLLDETQAPIADDSTKTRDEIRDEKYAAPPDLSSNSNPFLNGSGEFSQADLVRGLLELTNAAKRANTAFYPFDPRGLSAGPSMADREVGYNDWRKQLNESTSSLQILAEQTGGRAAVNTNDSMGYLKKMDKDMSDYYTLGYVSTNTDVRKRFRRVKIELVHPERFPGATLVFTDNYMLPTPPKIKNK